MIYEKYRNYLRTKIFQNEFGVKLINTFLKAHLELWLRFHHKNIIQAVLACLSGKSKKEFLPDIMGRNIELLVVCTEFG